MNYFMLYHCKFFIWQVTTDLINYFQLSMNDQLRLCSVRD